MSKFELLELVGDPLRRTVALPQSQWFADLTVHAIDAELQTVTGDHETCAVLLSGTFDLQGGNTAWPSRGARSTPMQGRPVAVFLPPNTAFAATNGAGEILAVAARQPEQAPLTDDEALQQKPLLPLAGSGKAFDPASGQWQPMETFATSAEHLTPRRIEHVELDGVTVERVFAADYKAATLTMDEVVLQDGKSLSVGDLALPDACECVVYVRAEDRVRLDGQAEQTTTAAGEAAVLWPDSPATLRITATGGPAYVALFYAGK